MPRCARRWKRRKRNEPRTLDLQARICEIPAPPFKEAVRGQELKRLFQELGLRDVRIDEAGNVIGVRPGKAAHPNLVFAAHLDTVFPEGTNVKVTREGDVMKAPGIGDDCRGLAVMLAVIRALERRPRGDSGHDHVRRRRRRGRAGRPARDEESFLRQPEGTDR